MDRDAIDRVGLPSIVLMENAGQGAARHILQRYAPSLAHVVVLAGPGNNGGDAFVVARHLWIAGVRAEVFLVGVEPAKLGGDAAINLAALGALGVDVRAFDGDGARAFDRALDRATVIVDGLFGTGLERPLRDPWAALITRLGAADPASAPPIVSLDLPSGVDADTGALWGLSLRATTTLTFGAHKRGLHHSPGVERAGEVVVIPIGVPAPREAEAFLVDGEDVERLLAPRALAAHKGSAGHVVVFAGSTGHTGAALLCSHAAFRAGAGLVTLAARAEAFEAIEAKVVEAMTTRLEPGEDGLAQALRLAEGKRCALVGPGLGLDDEARALALHLIRGLTIPCVVDADALTHLAGDPTASSEAPAPRVLLPHPGEAARLLGVSTEAIQADRFTAAARIAERYGAAVVLKGARTVVAAKGQPLRVIARGTPALGVAGTGDVLAGVVAAFSGLGTPLEAAAVAAYVHACAGERASRGDRGLLAHEVADAIPALLAERFA